MDPLMPARASFVVLVLSLACGGEPKPEAAALTGFVVHLDAFQAALATAPAEANGITAPEGVTLQVFCGDVAECPEANTKMVSERTVERFHELQRNAARGRHDFNQDWFDEHELAALPKLRFFATRLPEETTNDAAWHGRVVVWDALTRSWLGAVRVDLERGRVPEHAYAYFDGYGNQVSGPVSDHDRDTARANRDFQNLLPHAFRAAVASGRNVDRIDQAMRQGPRPLGRTLAADAVVFAGGPDGRLAAYSGGTFLDLGTDEVTDLWSTGDGFVYRRAKNALEERVPWLLRVKDDRVEDLTFFSDLRSISVDVVGEPGDVWLRVHGSEGVGQAGKWADGDWQLGDLSGLAPTIRRVTGVDECDGTIALAASGPDGQAVHARRADAWTTVVLPRSSVGSIVLESATSALVGTHRGLLRVNLETSEVEQLSRRGVFSLFDTPQGAWVTTRRGPISPVEFFQVQGSRLSSVRSLRTRGLTDVAVGPDGTIAVLARGVLHRRTPDGEILRVPEEGVIPGTTATMEVAVDAHRTVWIASTAGLFVATDAGLHTLAVPPLAAAQPNIREVCILGSGPELTAADLRPVP